MNWTFSILLFSLLLGGCASNTISPDADRDKAAELNAELGVRYMAQGHLNTAMEKLQKSLKYNEKYGVAHHYIAELYRRLGEREKADEHYRLAMKYGEDNSALHNNYGVFLCSTGRFAEADEQFQTVLRDPLYAGPEHVYENLGLCWQRKPDYDRAENYLRRALQINPRLPKSLIGMGELSFARANYMSARAYLQRYFSIGPETAQTLWLGIRIERKLGDQVALTRYEKLLQANFRDSAEFRFYQESLKR